MSAWDADDYDDSRWANEKVGVDDDDVAEAWDAEEEDTPKTETPASQPSKPAPKSKQTLKKLIEAREKAEATEGEVHEMDPYLEKKRKQELQEAADLENSRTLFGNLAVAKDTTQSPLDTMDPKTEKEFEQYAASVSTYITKHEKSYHYPHLLKTVLKNATQNMGSKELNEIVKSLTVIVNEKIKDEKNAAGGKKKTTKAAATKKTLQVDNEMNYEDFGDDDFM
ncbi:eukaryotic translation initiation factor 3 subunit 1 [Heterostelium album PN500]|uniref:Eukaryotic translation initiation factor 3 subunit J n=1 Tax=Heterostelium pallidum (strain ATCC 26659 / Pp 5 / PN500) TaxID=670386 RepID=D3AWC8_HETP5|nr:eukaryotic translation initiation factor 3 subunit 1 [Heterostelium album PN500]EFA86601.1 eukaryotic translation initiation factor 3 subunit 1 [Heterostelium album PN500]|eukprot:XP_020438706.1 eukaryotic translation initiation factor 3 subunit 1 [Heterostelium album PN500]